MSPDSISSFLDDTIVAPYAKLFPNIVFEIYDRFELSSALPKAIKNRFNDEHERQRNQPLLIRKKLGRMTSLLEKKREMIENINPKLSKNAEISRKTNTDSSVFRSSVSLVSRNKSSNPMLKNGQRRYNGGHFTDKLSNVTELFREVKQAPTLTHADITKIDNSKKTLPLKPSMTLRGSPQKRKAHARFLEPRRNLNFCSPQRKIKKAHSSIARKFNQRVIHETPIKQRTSFGSTPEKSPGIRAPVRSILDEVSISRKRRANASSRNSLYLDEFASNR